MAFHEERFSNLHHISSASQTTPDKQLIGNASRPDGSEDVEEKEEVVLVCPLDYEVRLPVKHLPSETNPGDEATGSPSTHYFLSIFLVPLSSVSYQALARSCGRPIKQGRSSEGKRGKTDSKVPKTPPSTLLNVGEGLGIDLAAYDMVLAVDPSGWNKKCRLYRVHEDRVWGMKIPYSEHCSFTEILSFVGLVNPRRVIPTVSLPQYRAQESLIVEKALRLSTYFSNTQPISRFFSQKAGAVEQGFSNSMPKKEYLAKSKVEKDHKAKQKNLFSYFSALKPLVKTFIGQYSKLSSNATCACHPDILNKGTGFEKKAPLDKTLEQQKYLSKEGDISTENTTDASTNTRYEFIIIDTSDDDDTSVEEIVQCAQKVRI
ncbi:unnamed protein product [Phytomonas sp. Hart1]|nr:unnamed protein product [Phytomonas sp. Hart1]|eukprot:CCW66467.1 unnamed protein product [Phytomonas sp. isolate Hart1]